MNPVTPLGTEQMTGARDRNQKRRNKNVYCKNCGMQIEDGSVYCPKCGATQKVAAPSFTADSPAPATNNTLAIVGFVVALISLLINFWGIVGIAATILSVLGYLGCKQKNQKGKGLAIAGIVIGAISVVWGAISLMALAVM